ncbi:MAG: hypothetical protein HRT87_11150 [Legionellales bacterium]|nr:hypothetical protein [Legionellales bacterium]
MHNPMYYLRKWLLYEPESSFHSSLSDFDRIMFEIRPCDVLLIEGRSRISNVIRMVTASPWTHACIYIGRLHDINNPLLRKRVKESYSCSPDEQLIIESILGAGTVVRPASIYKKEHIRICRPNALSIEDSQAVISFVIGRLGIDYDIRHIIDLMRFLLPWSILPRKWRSTLFHKKPGKPTQQICSSMLAEAFMSVNYPILPIVKHVKSRELKFLQRNHKLFTPSDFDYSPFFEIIKYPIVELHQQSVYKNLPWEKQ